MLCLGVSRVCHLCPDARVVHVVPDILWWLTRRQLAMSHASEAGMTDERLAIRHERLKEFRESEIALVVLLMSVVESATMEVVNNAVS